METVFWGENILISLDFDAAELADASAPEILDLLRQSVPEIRQSEQLSLSVFPGRKGLLIFAQLPPAQPQLFSFSSLGEAFDALLEVPSVRRAVLYEFPACAVLEIETDYPLTLREFGEPLPGHGNRLPSLREHARRICRVPQEILPGNSFFPEKTQKTSPSA